MTETAPNKAPEIDFDADTKLRMWTTTVALQNRHGNQSFEGAIQNAAKLYEYLKGGDAPAESTLKVVKTLNDAR